jgi:hypothetical protein
MAHLRSRSPRPLSLLARTAVVAVIALVAACSSSSDGPAKGSLVVGVQSEDFGGLVDSVHIVATIDGKVASDQTLAIGASTPTALPKEIVLEGAPGARAEVIVDATTSSGGPGPVVTRRASALLVANVKKLLRLNLETRCSTFSAPGSTAPVAPTCAAPQTCAAGRCVAEDIPLDQLEDYEPSWATSPPDICRPAQHGPPELYLGTGQTDYAPLADGQTVQLERGPQGGHHIWIAARMKNLRQSGSRTLLTARLPDDPAAPPIAPAAYVFTFDRDEGNYCKLWGLRFQLDSGASDLAADYKRFLGKRLEVTVEVVDSTGGRATSTHTIQVAPLLLCPDGTTTSCN